MSVKAEWHTPELVAELDADELFAPAERIEEVGTPVPLRDDPDQLGVELTESIRAESQLYERGVTCRIKDAQDSSCHACPLYREDGSPLSELCAIGRKQERICTRLLVMHHASR